jgi:D-alanyl-D-alanine dipeptidase
MKTEALQALQHVRTTLAYQLTPEAVSELLEPIQRVLNGGILDHVELTVPYIAAHNAKVDKVLDMASPTCIAHMHALSTDEGFRQAGAAFDAFSEAIDSLRL